MAIFNSYVKLPEGSSKPFEKKPSDFSTASTASRWANGWQPQWLSGGGLHDVLRSDMGSFLRRGGDQWLILHGYEE